MPSRLLAVPRLIHLNGPPGIGKSTLAQMYADEHPGVLNLDIDRLRALVGGWRDRFAETGELVRPLALDMAGTHLRAGTTSYCRSTWGSSARSNVSAGSPATPAPPSARSF